jgi:LEA14-like dessication related protein
MMYLQRLAPLLLGAVLTGCCLSCAARPALNVSPPVAPQPPPLAAPPVAADASPETRENPTAGLTVTRIEAAGLYQVTLFLLLEARNPRNSAASVAIHGGQAAVNGLPPAESPLRGPPGPLPPVAAGASQQIPLELTVDVGALPPDQGDFDEYRVEVALGVDFLFGPRETAQVTVTAGAVFPRLREPDFTISAIAIQKADLINTRFLVKLRVDNPNFFPLELTAFSYKLYGEGRFWAEGEETEVLRVPARSFAETELSLIMNFINMRRSVLDQIVALGQVNYRFAGEAEIRTGLEFLPRFPVDFDRSGRSTVID